MIYLFYGMCLSWLFLGLPVWAAALIAGASFWAMRWGAEVVRVLRAPLQG